MAIYRRFLADFSPFTEGYKGLYSVNKPNCLIDIKQIAHINSMLIDLEEKIIEVRKRVREPIVIVVLDS